MTHASQSAPRVGCSNQRGRCNGGPELKSEGEIFGAGDPRALREHFGGASSLEEQIMSRFIRLTFTPLDPIEHRVIESMGDESD